MIRYRTTKYGYSIKEEEFDRETANFLIRKHPNGKETRIAKQSDWGVYHETKVEARQHLEKQLKARIANTESGLTDLRQQLKIVEAL